VYWKIIDNSAIRLSSRDSLFIKAAMQLVATFIAGSAGPGISAEQAEDIRRTLSNFVKASTDAPDWLAPGIACDISLEGQDLVALRAAMRTHFRDASFDAVIQPAEGRVKSLLVADMDSTIVTSETLDELADHAGLKEQIAAITERAMRGEIDFKGALRDRVSMLKGLPAIAVEDTLSKIELTPGARTLVSTMRAAGAYTALVSGGFSYFTARIAKICGFHEDRANELLISDGVLTGKVAEPILDKDSKLLALNQLAASRGIPLSATMATGDGANDLPMIEAAGLGVAFRAKPAVEVVAPAAIRHGDLTALLYIQGYRQTQFVKD
jgi:phosphoserine phosphatase